MPDQLETKPGDADRHGIFSQRSCLAFKFSTWEKNDCVAANFSRTDRHPGPLPVVARGREGLIKYAKLHVKVWPFENNALFTTFQNLAPIAISSSAYPAIQTVCCQRNLPHGPLLVSNCSALPPSLPFASERTPTTEGVST